MASASTLPALVVVRGAYRGTDPTYACLTHDVREGHYGSFEILDGRVQNRTVYRASERAALERRMAEANAFDAVYVDGRDDARLLALTAPKHALPADLNLFRRAKSDGEMRVLRELGQLSRDSLDASSDGRTFRGATATGVTPYRAAHARVARDGFVEYRGGFQSPTGLFAELSRVEPTNDAFRGLLERTHRGLDAVQREMRVGASVDALTETFRAHLAPEDRLYGRVLAHVGYEPEEADIPLTHICEFDVLRLGATVGLEGTPAARVYRSVHAFDSPSSTYRATEGAENDVRSPSQVGVGVMPTPDRPAASDRTAPRDDDSDARSVDTESNASDPETTSVEGEG